MRSNDLERRLASLFLADEAAEVSILDALPLPVTHASLAYPSRPLDSPVASIDAARRPMTQGGLADLAADLMRLAPGRLALLKTILNQIPEPVFIKDREHRWVVVNAAFCDLLGKPSGDLLGRTDHDVFPRPFADEAWALDDALFVTGQPSAAEQTIDIGRGGTRTWQTMRQPLTDASGTTFYLVGTIQDLTARRQVERALRETETMHRAERQQWEDRLRRLKRGLLVQFSFFGMLAGLSVGVLVAARAPDVVSAIALNSPEPSITATLAPSPTATLISATRVPQATDTLAPSPSATFTPSPMPPQVTIALTHAPPLIATDGAVIPPPPAAPLREFAPNVINIVLLGSDRRPGDTAWRTDVVILVSVDPDVPSVTMLSFPRDLWVYIPGWRWQRINLADERGESSGFPGGGPGLIKQTIQYNFGAPVHYFARVDFGGYKRLIDSVGGVDVVADCPLYDIFPDVPDGANDIISGLELSTVPTGTIDIPIAGVYRLDGKHALWYARSRKTTSDFDRSRRQQRVLRALWNEILKQGLLGQVPQLWDSFTQSVETDLTLNDVLYLADVGRRLDSTHIRSRFIDGSMLIWNITDTGANVLRYNYQEVEPYLDETFAPLPKNLVAQAPTRVDVVNRSGHPDWEIVAADRLGWSGFLVQGWSAGDGVDPQTTLIDYTMTAKGSRLPALMDLFQVRPENVVHQPDSNSPVAYRIIVGADFEPCQPPSRGRWPAPPPTPIPTPDAVPETTPAP